jgi:DNA-binding Lrp family transcriptional regulator
VREQMLINRAERIHSYRKIYELLWENPRIYSKSIATALHLDPRTASSRLREAFEQGYISTPQIRKRSYSNINEYLYFLNCTNPLEAYIRFSEDRTIPFHAAMCGFSNMWVTSKKKLNIDEEIVLSGYQSDYHVAFASLYTWERAIHEMMKKVAQFNPDLYEPLECIKTRKSQKIEWDSEDEVLYRYFKYNLRNPFSPVMKKHLISTTKIYEFLKRLPETCTIMTRWLPESIYQYDPYLFMFHTDYEDFLIDVFSQLPTSPVFLKADDTLLIYVHVKRTDMADIDKLYIPILIKELFNKHIIHYVSYAIVEYYWKKEL